MVNIATKVRIGIASGVIATAAVLPAAPAQAEPAAPATTGTLGSSAAGAAPIWLETGRDGVASSPVGAVSRIAAAPAAPSYFYLGAANSNPAERTTILSFNPLGLLPGFVRPFFGWFAALNLEACVAGLSAKVGPYGTVSVSLGRSC